MRKTKSRILSRDMRAQTTRAVLLLGIAFTLGGCAFFATGTTTDSPPGQEPSFFPPDSSGLQHGLVTGRYYKRIAADPEPYFDELYSIGLNWIRIEFEEFWDPDSPVQPAGYDDPIMAERVARYRTIIEAAHERHIKVLGVIGVNSMPGGLVFEADGSLTVGTLSRYRDAVQWHLETYDVDAVEIWNEPWGFGFGSDVGKPERLAGYAELLVETYSNLKPLYPSVLFVAPVTANAEAGEWLGHHGWDITYQFQPEASIFNSTIVQEYRDNNEDKLPLDVISWHPYGTGGDPDDTSFYFESSFGDYYARITGQQSQFLAGAAGDSIWYEDVAGRPITDGYPIWFTEYGWEADSDAEEDGQARKLEQMIALMNGRPQIEVAFLYTYQDDESTVDSEGKKYGLRKNSTFDYEPKLAYYSFVGHSANVGVQSGGSVDINVVKDFLNAGGRPGVEGVE